MKPILVGEANPFGNGPEFDLWPDPPNCSGGRLQKILGLSRTEYLRSFDRLNLCRGKWRIRDARTEVSRILFAAVDGGGRDIILLGSKVCLAFDEEFKPFNVREIHAGRLIVLPHPSGRNRIWQKPGTKEQARALVIGTEAP